MDERNTPIVVEEQFHVSIERLWSALTNHDEMIKWFFDNIPSFKAEVGFETKFVVKTEQRSFTHCWRILEVIPNKKITYHWSYLEYPGEGRVTFEIGPIENGSKLRLTNEGLATFPVDIREFTRESCAGGWAYFLKGKLIGYLDKLK